MLIILVFLLVLLCFGYFSSVQWVDDKNKKKSCSAPQYIDLVMSFTQRNLDDESIFPTKYGLFYSYEIPNDELGSKSEDS